MARAHVDVTTAERHVLRDFTLNCKVALIRIRIFKVFLHVKCERQHWSKTRECLIVKSLSTELILRSSGDARSGYTCRTNRCYWSTRRTHSSLEHLHSIEQNRLGRKSRSQDALLLLHCVCDVGVESDGKQRVIVENSERASNWCLAVAPRIPCNRQSRRPVVLVARKTLLHAHRILRGEGLIGRESDSRKRIAQRQCRNLFRHLVVVTNTVIKR